jgi:hypothetical protein
MSLGDMSGPLCGMSDGATTNAQVAASSAAPIGEHIIVFTNKFKRNKYDVTTVAVRICYV